MNFISLPFAILLISSVLLLIIFKSQLIRKTILLVVSFIFYAFWDWRLFLLLIGFILFNYYFSLFLRNKKNEKQRKTLLIVNLIINLGFLGVFKYFNFFITGLNLLFAPFNGYLQTMNIILPLGISFYVFSVVSYIVDVYNETIVPTYSILDFALFVSFFPKIVSGPIQRASNFFTQLEQGIQITLSGLNEGVQLILRGMLKKLVIADRIGVMTNNIYASPSVFSSSSIWVAVLAYSVQIYFDFSGYTDMAIGISKMVGINLPQNFNLPYTSQSITEFWQRWHITLSSWFRDYLFYPLEVFRARGGNAPIFQSLNILTVFLLTGLWHGASWNFVLWGGLHGAFIILENLMFRSRMKPYPFSSIQAWLRSLFIYVILSFTWIPFRSPNWQTTLIIIKKLLNLKFYYNIEWYYIWALLAIPVVIIGGFLFQRFKWELPILSLQKPYTLAFLLFEILIIFFFFTNQFSPFIYFNF